MQTEFHRYYFWSKLHKSSNTFLQIRQLSQIFHCIEGVIKLRIDFFILSFFVGYILSFGLVRLSARADTHIERRCSRSRAEDVTITDVMIKTLDRKLDWGANDVMLGSDGLGFLVILKKAVSWDSNLGEACWDPKLGEASWHLKLDEASPVCRLRDAGAFVGSVSWDFDSGPRVQLGLTEERCRNSQHSKNCISLTLYRKTKPRSQ